MHGLGVFVCMRANLKLETLTLAFYSLTNYVFIVYICFLFSNPHAIFYASCTADHQLSSADHRSLFMVKCTVWLLYYCDLNCTKAEKLKESHTINL